MTLHRAFLSSALASFVDTDALRCEPFATRGAKVDLLFSVDDSASMPDQQAALAAVAAPLGGSNRGVRRGFTRDINQFRAWLTKDSVCDAGTCTGVSPTAACDSNGAAADGRNGGCWIGAGGTGNVPAEAILGAARKAVDDLTPGVPADQVDRNRSDAQVVVVLLGDADDQTSGYATSSVGCAGAPSANCEPVEHFADFFSGQNKLGKKIIVHAIACPDGASCKETQSTPRRHFQVVGALGGVSGDITSGPSIQAALAAIVSNVIGNGGRRLQEPPIGASIKVALAAVQSPARCNKADLPRSRVDGFDFDGRSGTLSLFGACRPPAPATAAAVSYRYWVKKANTGCAPIHCGGPCGAGTFCNPASCVCEPDIN